MAIKSKLFKLVETWIQEVRRESDPGASLAQYGELKPVALTFNDAYEEAVDAAMNRQGFQPLGAYAPVDNIVYCDPTTGLDTNPGTQTLPVQTLDRAFELLSEGWTRYGVLFLAAGTFVIPANVSLSWPKGTGGNAWPLQVIGTWVDSGQGPLVINPVVAGTLTPPASTTMTVAAAAWGANQWRGFAVRRTVSSGALTLTGRRYLVTANTANVLSVAIGSLGTAFQNNDTVVLEKPGTVIQFASFDTSYDTSWVIFRGVEFRQTAGAFVPLTAGRIQVESGWMTNGGAGAPTFGLENGAVLATGVIRGMATKTDASVTTQAYTHTDDTGVFLQGVTLLVGSTGAFGSLSTALLRNCVLDNAPASANNGSTLMVAFCAHSGTANLRAGAVGSVLSVQFTRLDGVTGVAALGAAVVTEDGSRLLMSSALVANTPNTVAPGDGVLVQNAAYASLTSVSGTANAGVGVRTTQFVRVKAVSPNVGVTVTGAGGDVVVGANPVTTWALIAAGAAVNTTDLAAAIPQICRVSA